MEFTGASYIPIINYNGEQCIILFKSSKANVYSDLGGHREENEQFPHETCNREVLEESLNTLNVILNNNSQHIFYKGYYCFFEKLNIDYTKLKNTYKNNYIFIHKNNNLPDHWYETKNIDIFPLKNLTNLINFNSKIYNCKNVNGEQKNIWYRPIKYIKYAIINNIISNNNIVNNFITKHIQKIEKNYNNIITTTTITI